MAFKWETEVSNWGKWGLDDEVPWLKQREIALLGSDGVNDVQPSGVSGTGEAAGRPVHTLAIAVLGVPLVDNGYFDDAAREAARRAAGTF